jgi:hypothetical protein
MGAQPLCGSSGSRPPVPLSSQQPTRSAVSRSPTTSCRTVLHTDFVLSHKLTALTCLLLPDCVVITRSHHPHHHLLHLAQTSTSLRRSMYRRLVIVVLFTLYLKPAAAANPAMDFSLSMSYMEQFQPDLEGTLRCIECALSCWDCVCVLSQSSSSYLPALTIEPTHYTPPSTNDYNPTVDLSDLVHWMEDARLPLFDNTIQFMNANETTVQSTTVQAHVESIYTPGDRQRRPSPKRQALRKGGYACNIIGCNKAFDRACELK